MVLFKSYGVLHIVVLHVLVMCVAYTTSIALGVHNVTCQYVHLAPMNYPEHAQKCPHLLSQMKCG